MKIGINALFLIPNEVGGTEYHLRSYIKLLERTDKENDYILFCNRENYPTFTLKHKNWKKVLCPINGKNRRIRIIYEQVLFPFLVSRYKCDVVHSTGYFGPIFTKAKKIITVHDANWKDHPEDFSFLTNLTLKIFIGSNLKTADKIITVSSFARSRLLYYYPNLDKKLEVVSGRIGDEFIKLAKKKLEHPLKGKDYILCVSALYPHKNIPYLLDFWEEIISKNKNLHLVLIGRHGRDEKKVVDRVKKMERVVYFQKVSLEKLVAFYQHAKVFVSPSIYEGFGLPVYEATFLGLYCFVGNKKLYSSSIQPLLHQLTKDSSRDVKLILSVISKVEKKSIN